MRNRRTLLLLAACAVIVAVALLSRGGTNAPGSGRPAFRPVAGTTNPTNTSSGYDKFKLIHTRNVFDPDRRPVHTGPAPAATPPPARADYVALTGTFFDGEKKPLAFFSGTRPEYNKILGVRDQIAGATINQITGANVEVVRNGKPVTVAVGQTVPFDGSAPTAAPLPAAPDTAPAGVPAPAAGPSAPAPAAGLAPGTGSAAPAAAGALPASPGAPASSKQDEIRRRMEERHRQEQK